MEEIEAKAFPFNWENLLLSISKTYLFSLWDSSSWSFSSSTLAFHSATTLSKFRTFFSKTDAIWLDASTWSCRSSISLENLCRSLSRLIHRVFKPSSHSYFISTLILQIPNNIIYYVYCKRKQGFVSISVFPTVCSILEYIYICIYVHSDCYFIRLTQIVNPTLFALQFDISKFTK